MEFPSFTARTKAQSANTSPGGPQKDLCLVVWEGSLADVDSATAQLKNNGGNINSRNAFGLTPLHIATWRNHVPIVRRLLDAGADPDARDGESGWSSLHRAFHFGHLAVANILLQSSASILLEDCKSRTPVDLLSGPVSQAIGSENDSVATEVYSWGSGTNYQLGTGNAHLKKLPCEVDHGSVIKLISAAKFHSVAVTTRGEVYTWGFGRGGRLGHPDFDIHSRQAAVITPRQVTFGLGSRQVKTIAAANITLSLLQRVAKCLLGDPIKRVSLATHLLILNQHLVEGNIRHYPTVPRQKQLASRLVPSQGSPSESPGMNRWFNLDFGIPSSIRSIQIEERL